MSRGASTLTAAPLALVVGGALAGLALLARDPEIQDVPAPVRGATGRVVDSRLAASPTPGLAPPAAAQASERPISLAAAASERPSPLAGAALRSRSPQQAVRPLPEPGKGLPGSPRELARTNQLLVATALDAARPLTQRIAALRRVWLPAGTQAHQRQSLLTQLEVLGGDSSAPAGLRSAALKATWRARGR